MMAANYRHIGGGVNRLGRHYSRFFGFWPMASVVDQSLALRKSQNRESNRRRRVNADFERFIAARRAATDVKAKGGLLPGVMLDKGVLKITPIEKSTPPEAEAVAARLYAMLPRIRITDLLSEVAQWTLFTECFTHLRTGNKILRL